MNNSCADALTSFQRRCNVMSRLDCNAFTDDRFTLNVKLNIPFFGQFWPNNEAVFNGFDCERLVLIQGDPYKIIMSN